MGERSKNMSVKKSFGVAFGAWALVGGFVYVVSLLGSSCGNGLDACDIETTLLDTVESELGVTCPNVRPQDNEAICTEGVAVGIDREKHTAVVWYNVNHYPSAQWGVIQCVDACGGCDVLRGNGWDVSL